MAATGGKPLSSLKYVCVSDLHLGARDSILTHVADAAPGVDALPDHLQVSATLQAFGAALRSQVRNMAPSEPPILVLLGDALDMAFSPIGCAALGFQRFLEAIFPPGETPVFADVIYMVPGNHDHHLWDMAKDRLYLAQIADGSFDGLDTAAGEEIPRLRQTTGLFTTPAVRSSFLTELARGLGHVGELEVRLAYPNFGLLSADRERAVVLHHGHFTESLYCLMSTFSHWLNPAFNATTVEELECQNGPWIDFLWSSLGNAGVLGDEASVLYETMQNPAATREASQRLAKRLTDAAMGVLPMHGAADVKMLAQRLAAALVDVSIGRVTELERNSYGTVLSGSGIEGLQRYLGTAVLNQIKSELSDHVPRDLTFIFGHTHKPFEDYVLGGTAAPELPLVATYNTGGWVLDEPRMPAAQGASAIFIDNELSVAALRLFNSPLNETRSPVELRTCGTPGAFAETLGHALEQTKSEWGTFSDTAAHAVAARSQQMARRFFNPYDDPVIAERQGA